MDSKITLYNIRLYDNKNNIEKKFITRGSTIKILCWMTKYVLPINVNLLFRDELNDVNVSLTSDINHIFLEQIKDNYHNTTQQKSYPFCIPIINNFDNLCCFCRCIHTLDNIKNLDICQRLKNIKHTDILKWRNSIYNLVVSYLNNGHQLIEFSKIF